MRSWIRQKYPVEKWLLCSIHLFAVVYQFIECYNWFTNRKMNIEHETGLDAWRVNASETNVHVQYRMARWFCQYGRLWFRFDYMPKLKRCGFFETAVDTIESSGKKIFRFNRSTITEIKWHCITFHIIKRGGSISIISLDDGKDEKLCALLIEQCVKHWNNAKFVWHLYIFSHRIYISTAVLIQIYKTKFNLGFIEFSEKSVIFDNGVPWKCLI